MFKAILNLFLTIISYNKPTQKPYVKTATKNNTSYSTNYISHYRLKELMQQNNFNPMSKESENDLPYFHSACKEGYLDLVQEMLKQQKNQSEIINHDFNGFTPKQLASEYKRKNVENYLNSFSKQSVSKSF